MPSERNPQNEKNDDRAVQFADDVHFDPDKLFWKGIWTPCGGESEVKLERPASGPATTLNPMVGDWQGGPGNSSD